MPFSFPSVGQSVRTRGIVGTIKWAFSGYVKVNNFIVFHRPAGLPPAMPANPALSFSTGSLEALQDLRRGRDDLPFEFYCDEVFGFREPYLAFYEDELAAIHWLVRRGEPSRFLTLGEGDAELNYNTVLPRFRGKRIAQALMTHLIRASHARGDARLFGVVHVSNIPQWKQMIDLGFEPVDVVVHFGPFRPKASMRYVRR